MYGKTYGYARFSYVSYVHISIRIFAVKHIIYVHIYVRSWKCVPTAICGGLIFLRSLGVICHDR